MEYQFTPIGTIHTPHKSLDGMPIQPAGAQKIRGTIRIAPEYAVGLKDLDGFSHIILLYHFHRVKESKLLVTPFMDSRLRGVFATRAPKRPNAIGLSVVKLVKIEETTLHIENVDMLDGTPLLDIKPYIPDIDAHAATRIGWLKNAGERFKKTRSDKRFE